jgi:hypothetical protein
MPVERARPWGKPNVRNWKRKQGLEGAAIVPTTDELVIGRSPHSISAVGYLACKWSMLIPALQIQRRVFGC